jgi:hypothetical protein
MAVLRLLRPAGWYVSEAFAAYIIRAMVVAAGTSAI